MKKFLLPSLALLASLLTAQAQTPYFYATNLVLVQQATTPSTGAGVTIVQMQTNGTMVNSTNLPTSGPTSFILGTSTTEGFVTLSANGEYLVLAGYNALPGVAPAGATAVVAPRAVATLDAYGTYAVPISNTNIESTFNNRGAVSDGLGNFWVTGNGGTGASIANGEFGIIYVGTATQPTNVCVAFAGTGNERCLEIYNGNLYFSTGSASNGVFMISNVAGAYPTTTTAGTNVGITNILAEATSSGPYAFQINAANTIAYLAEDSRGGIQKWTGVNGLWTSNYTLPVLTSGTTASGTTTNAYGCAVDFSQNPPVIYATTGETPINRLIRIVDTGASATPTLLASSPSNTVWRGVRFGPAYPSPIATQPVSETLPPGQTASFSVVAAILPSSYQWYSNSVAISGATSSSYSFGPVTSIESGAIFTVVVSNLYGTATSANAVLTVGAAFFANGNLAVVRIGGTNQVVTTSGPGNQVWIDQYTTSGTLINSLAIPTNGPTALILNGEPYEGLMSLTPDRAHLVICGFNTNAPFISNGVAQNIAFSPATVIPRCIATIDINGTYALPIVNTNIFSTYTITGAASDGSNFWALGTGATAPSISGVVYCGTASAPATVQVASNLFGSGRGLNIFNNALYADGYPASATVSPQSGAFELADVSGALPTVSTSFSLPLPTGAEASDTPYDVAINSAGTIAYVADSTAGIVRFSNNGSGWVSNYTVLLTNAGYASALGSQRALSVTADFTQTPPVVYATTDETITNRLVTFQDSGAGATVINLASNLLVIGANGVTNTFRGVRFTPVPSALITVEPVAFTGPPGVTATFTVTAVGTPAPGYQWYSNSVAVSGATSSSFSLANINTSQSGSLFYVVVSNIYGSSQSSPVALTVLNPSIVNAPVGETNLPGSGPVTLCVTAQGTGTLTYQWLSNGVAIVGANSSCYTAPNSAVISSSAYSVIVSNSLNQSITSAVTDVAFSPYLLYDTFTYPNGNLFGNVGSPWVEISGTQPINVTNDRVYINQTLGSLGTAFAQAPFTAPQNGTIIWASFIVNLTNLPAAAGGTYLADFADTNFGFYGRIIAVTSNNPSYTPDIAATAYPGTYRIGIANKAASVSAVAEVDMAPGIDYQVVEYYDINNGFCQVSVNPSQANYSQVYNPLGAPSPLTSGVTSDSFTQTGHLPMAGYSLRQAASVGIMSLRNLEVSYDWNGTGTGYAAVTANITPALPVIGFVSAGVTNYSGNSNALEVAASGIGLGYVWYQNGAKLSDGNSLLGSATPLLEISPLAGTNSGSYTVVVSNSVGSVTSTVVVVSVNATPTPPIFTLQPVSTISSLGANVTFTATAVGTGPIAYQWNTDGSPNGGTGSSYTLTRVTTNLSGNTYSVTATGGASPPTTSSNAVLTVNGPIVTNIAYLRSLQVTSAAPTITIPAASSTTVYQVTGTVIEFTNIESSTYAEYWIQDNTAGIEFFVTDPTFRPNLGDVITASGVVDIFDDAVELDGAANNPAEPYTVVSTNGEGQPLPYAPNVISWGFATANPGLSSLVYQGSLGTFTNCYFQAPGGTFAGGATYVVTNSAGLSYSLYIGQSSGPDLVGTTVPGFAYSITGVYDQFNAVYELNLTAGSDIVTAPPPAVTKMTATLAGGNITIKWQAVPNSYTYTILSSTNLKGPWTPLSPSVFPSSTNATFTQAVSGNAATYYTIKSP